MTFLDLPKRFYSKLPECVRNRLRFFKNPRTGIIHTLVRFSTSNQVAQGPFKELSLNTSDCYPPMLLGTYEQELHDIFYNWFDRKLRNLVCIGAAEGYYAVGMARRDPTLNVIAYELDSYQRSQLVEVIRQNNVSNVRVLKRCTKESLIDTLQSISSPPYIICDIEGGEVELLDPVQITALKQAVILVEIHEELVNGCEEVIRKRFKKSHNIFEIINSNRKPGDFPSNSRVFQAIFSEKTRLDLMNEGRASTMKWLVMEPDSI
jgi:hypothetical protein